MINVFITLTKTDDLQANKLISLCGWEPRFLPYFVDYGDREDLALNDIDVSGRPGSVARTHNPHISIYSSEPNEHLEANDDLMASAQYDPNSVVFDCQLCGASVGLWTFSTTPRPVEFIRIVGEVNGESNNADRTLVIHSSNGDSGALALLGNEGHFEANTSKDSNSVVQEAPPSLNLTIAGGPPLAKQSFRPTISLPVIGRNLRARFSSDFELRPDAGQSNPTSNEPLQCLGSKVTEQFESQTDKSDCNILVEGSYSSERVISETNKSDSLLSSLSENRSVGKTSSEVIPITGGDNTLTTGESSLTDKSVMVSVIDENVQRGSGNEIVRSKQGDVQDGHSLVTSTQPLHNINRG